MAALHLHTLLLLHFLAAVPAQRGIAGIRLQGHKVEVHICKNTDLEDRVEGDQQLCIHIVRNIGTDLELDIGLGNQYPVEK